MQNTPEPQPVAPEVFLSAPDLAALLSRFGTFEQVSEAWQTSALQTIQENSQQLRARKPEKLDALVCETGGVRYRVYGVIHGWTGGVSEEYRELVRKSLQEEKTVLYEKMLGRFYGRRGAVEAPDFCMLKRTGQFVLGLRMMLIWPLFLLIAAKEILTELFTRSHETAEDNDYNNIFYHNIDPELRRGLDGSLPTRLQIEYELNHWGGGKGFWDLDLLLRVVPRSAYLAEFARAWAAATGATEIALVVGDRHLTEVRYFLEHPPVDVWTRRKASAHARQLARHHFLYHWHFALYMLTITLGSLVGSVPWLIAIIIAMQYFGSRPSL